MSWYLVGKALILSRSLKFLVCSCPFAFLCEFYLHLYIRILVPKETRQKPSTLICDYWTCIGFIFTFRKMDLFVMLSFHPWTRYILYISYLLFLSVEFSFVRLIPKYFTVLLWITSLTIFSYYLSLVNRNITGFAPLSLLSSSPSKLISSDCFCEFPWIFSVDCFSFTSDAILFLPFQSL